MAPLPRNRPLWSSVWTKTNFTLAALLAIVHLQAQPPSLPGKKLEMAPTIEGVIHPEEWAGAFNGNINLDAGTGHSAPEDAQFWIGYDDNYIYFAAKIASSNPASLRFEQYQTNVSLDGDDNVTLFLDLTNSLSEFNEFGMNARGATSLDLAGGRAAKREWSGDFVAKGRITEEGWEVEARIPWQLMTLPTAGVRDVRINVVRFSTHDQRSYTHAFLPAGRSADTPLWQGIPIPKAATSKTLKLLPYGFGGYDETNKKMLFKSGLDMKMEVTDKITAIGTINPDFRNIESQILSLDFSRFERLAAESRPFFQEGSQYENSALFASQRIGQIDAGVNTYGRLNDKLSFGIINATTFGKNNALVSNFTFDPTVNDSYRVTATRFTKGGLENNAYLLRYSRQLGPFNVFLRTMGTHDTEKGKGQLDTADLSYNDPIWSLFLGYDRTTPNFLPRLGFAPEVDFRGPSANVQYQRSWRKNPIAELGLSGSFLEYVHTDGSPYRRSHGFEADFGLRNRLALSTSYQKDRFEGEDDHVTSISMRFPRDDSVRNFRLQYDWGELALENYSSLRAGLNYRFGRRLQTGANYQVVRHGGYDDQLILTASYDLGHDQSVSGRLVKSNSKVGGYLSYRRSGNRGVEYYVIVGDPNSPTFRTSLVLKVVVPLELPLGPRAPRSKRK